MAAGGEEPVGSMGTDTSLAVLSDRPRLLYDYFKQLFAQVTNPPLDAIREELVTQIATSIGPEGNLLEPVPEACRQIKLKTPILNNDELARIRHVDQAGFKAATCPCCSRWPTVRAGLERAMDELLRAGEPRRSPTATTPDPVRPRASTRARADPEPARHRRRPPSPGARGRRAQGAAS